MSLSCARESHTAAPSRPFARPPVRPPSRSQSTACIIFAPRALLLDSFTRLKLCCLARDRLSFSNFQKHFDIVFELQKLNIDSAASMQLQYAQR